MANCAKLSAVLITKNETDNIEACLNSITWVDEIVILDSGSTDDTLEIACKFTDKIYTNSDWIGFGLQRQRAQEFATGDWVFVIDADERVTPELKDEILSIIEGDNRNNVYAVPRLSWAFGSFIRHSGWYPDYVVRVYPRDRAHYDNALVHEKVVPDGGMNTVKLSSDLLHFTFRNLEQWANKTALFAAAWSDERYRRGKKSSIWIAIGHALSYFIKTYLFKRGFLDGRAGLLLAILGAYSRILKYSDLWLRNQPNEPDF